MAQLMMFISIYHASIEQGKQFVTRFFKHFWSNNRSLDNSIAKLRLELPSARDIDQMGKSENLPALGMTANGKKNRENAFVVIGINTAFSSRKRRDSVRETWMPQGSIAILIFYNENLSVLVWFYNLLFSLIR